MNGKINTRIIVLGAGLAGLGAGIQAKKMGHEPVILEKEHYVGGLFSNHEILGCDFDYGPKILVDTNNTQEILSYMKGNYEKYEHDERTYLSKYGLLGFPLQRNLYQIPVEERNKIIESILETQKSKKVQINNFKEWLISNYGEYFARNILIPYEQKKWLVDLSQMDYQWALKRHLKVNIQEILEGAKRKLGQYRWYYYPKKGNITEVIKALEPYAGGILLSHEVTKIDLERKVVVAGGKEFGFDILINTIPMDYVATVTTPFPKKLAVRSKNSLKRLSILIFNLVFEGNYELDGTALYFPEQEFIFRRVSILENLCPALAREGMTPITAEVSVEDVKKVDKDEILQKVIGDLGKIDQFKPMGKPIATGCLEVDFAYPLQTNELVVTVSEIQNYLKKFGIYNAGRGGTFNYCDGDVAFGQGRDAVIEAFVPVAERREAITSVSIGIPVFNEEQNIGRLLHSLLKQSTEHCRIDTIYVLSDGSTDGTGKIVEEIARSNDKVVLIHSDERHGKQRRLNDLFSYNQSDVFVCIDGDIIPHDSNAVENLIVAMRGQNADIASSNDIVAQSSNFKKNLLNVTEELWQEVRLHLHDKNTMHNSRGRMFAITKEITSMLVFPQKVLDNYYLYLWGKEHNKKFVFVENSLVLHKAPDVWWEHLHQASKSTRSSLRTALYEYFDKDLVDKESRIAFDVKLRAITKYVLRNPMKGMLALVMVLVDNYLLIHDELYSLGMWKPANSTKQFEKKK